MSIHDQFIPGQWVDNIDVNDFVSLNKKPFLKEPIFLQKSTENTLVLAEKINEMMKNDSITIPNFPSIKDAKAIWIDKKVEMVPGIQHNKLGNDFETLSSQKGKQKTVSQLFDDVATSEIKKAIKMKLFAHTPTEHPASFLHPDVRKIALYGTKALIRDKKMYLKSLEKHLQTYEWMQRRIAVQYEMEALKELESFCKLYKVNITEPAQSAKEVITNTYLTILAAVIESPFISFSLTNLIPFFDIYIEQDFSNGIINETEAQELIDQFFLKLCTIHFSLPSELLEKFDNMPILFGETFGGSLVNKTTYRFLSSLERFNLHPFAVRVIWDRALPISFRNFCGKLLNKGVPIIFFNGNLLDDKNNSSIYPNGLYGVSGDDVLFDAGACDLEKVFYLALNGGKDVSTNSNLLAVTQPIRQGKIEFEEVYSKFKDFFAYVLSVYSEMMNIVCFLNESKNHHSLRSSLMSNLTFYHTQFGFFHVEKMIQILHSISIGKFEVIRDNSGWIKEIVPQIGTIDEYESMLTNVVTFIEQELRKIPTYKGGRAKVRLYQGEVYEQIISNPYKKHWSIPIEISKATFHHSLLVSKDENIISMVENWFNNDFSELELSTNSEDVLINGILFKKRS